MLASPTYDLPYEIWRLIFAYFTDADLRSLRRVKFFNALATSLLRQELEVGELTRGTVAKISYYAKSRLFEPGPTYKLLINFQGA
ncbi:hypothetical protein ONZ45_g13860 [Pleurotus djamor]|nr:hypothetical protein ONZ45_g13860 [Pleurotus djamor]